MPQVKQKPTSFKYKRAEAAKNNHAKKKAAAEEKKTSMAERAEQRKAAMAARKSAASKVGEKDTPKATKSTSGKAAVKQSAVKRVGVEEDRKKASTGAKRGDKAVEKKQSLHPKRADSQASARSASGRASPSRVASKGPVKQSAEAANGRSKKAESKGGLHTEHRSNRQIFGQGATKSPTTEKANSSTVALPVQVVLASTLAFLAKTLFVICVDSVSSTCQELVDGDRWVAQKIPSNWICVGCEKLNAVARFPQCGTCGDAWRPAAAVLSGTVFGYGGVGAEGCTYDKVLPMLTLLTDCSHCASITHTVRHSFRLLTEIVRRITNQSLQKHPRRLLALRCRDRS